ncbi:MAG: hypothetical protein H6654_09350 [Ardenticatenaceae bacterium]|nr:hypothetical protein [Anaerolineales bacterium]MCB8938618.1 hypothetical protein [Ardenticatenaceae bacterium]MCB8973751.1 hypothetical protein [Ardenticatenaceae bacterium]
MHPLFQTPIEYSGPPPGETNNSQTQIIPGLHNSTIWAATEQINKPSLLNSLPVPGSEAVQGRQPLLPAPPLQARWQPTSPAKITLTPGQSLSLGERLLAILALANPSNASGNRHPAAENVAVSRAACPFLPDFDPYPLAWAAANRAISQLVAAGIDPAQIALLAEFDGRAPDAPEQLGILVRGMQGCFDTAVSHQTPFLFGQYTLSENSDTLRLTALGVRPDGSQPVTPALKQAGNFLFVMGDTRAELGGSQFNAAGGRAEGSRTLPRPAEETFTRLRLLHQAIQAGLVQACQPCAGGGIAAALAQMCRAGQLGAELQFIHVPRDWHAAYSTDEVILFAESLSRFLVEVRPEDAPRLRELLADVPHECVAVIGGERLVVNGRTGTPILNLSIPELSDTHH